MNWTELGSDSAAVLCCRWRFRRKYARTPTTPTKAAASGSPTPRPTLSAVLSLVSGVEEFVADEEAEDVDEVFVVWALVELDVVVVRNFVDVVFEEEDFILLELTMVVKGFKSPVIVKTPCPVWQSQLVRGSLSQQKPVLPQLRTPASESEL
jgi:hypothetical protein